MNTTAMYKLLLKLFEYQNNHAKILTCNLTVKKFIFENLRTKFWCQVKNII